MGAPMDLMNIFTIPGWGLAALGVSLVGTLLAVAIGFRLRRVPAWTLALAPLAAVAAWAAATAPDNMITLSVAIVSLGLALVQLLAGAVGLAPEQVRSND